MTAIDLTSEKLEPIVTLAEWDRLPVRRNGKKFSPTTLTRWATRGCRGVKLEAVCVGITLCSSREALLRFFERQAAARAGGASVSAA